MTSPDLLTADQTAAPKRRRGRIVRDLSVAVATNMITLGLIFGVAANVNYFFELHEQAKPVSSEPGRVDTEQFTAAIMAMPDPHEYMVRARLTYAGRNDPGMAAFNAYRMSPQMMAAYYEGLARRVNKECRDDLASTCPRPVKDSIASAFGSYTQSIAYDQWQSTRQMRLQHALAENPAFSRLREEWPGLTKEQKLQTLQYVTNAITAAYGDEGLSMRAPRVQETVLMPNTAGTYTAATNIIDVSPVVLESYNFDQAMEIIGHEGGHRVHAGLIALSRTKEGRDYLRAQAIQHDVRILSLSKSKLNMDRFDASGDVGVSHDIIPDERDADDIGRDVSLSALNAQAGNMAPRVASGTPFTFRLRAG